VDVAGQAIRILLDSHNRLGTIGAIDLKGQGSAHPVALEKNHDILHAALFFDQISRGGDTPVVVLALSIASITYGALLGTYVLAAAVSRARGRDVVGAVLASVVLMLVVVFAARLAVLPGLAWLAPVGTLAWPWYVPAGTLLTILTGLGLSAFPHAEQTA